MLLPATAGIQGVATGERGEIALWSAAGEVFSIAERKALSRFARRRYWFLALPCDHRQYGKVKAKRGCPPSTS